MIRSLAYFLSLPVMVLGALTAQAHDDVALQGQDTQAAQNNTEQTVFAKASLSCSNDDVTLDTDFPSGNAAKCDIVDGRFVLMIEPEDAPPINCSPWYGFRLTPKNKKVKNAEVELNYSACGHRYWPKISPHGIIWNNIDKKYVRVTGKGDAKKAYLTVDFGKVGKTYKKGTPLFVSAQEILVPSIMDFWVKDFEGRDDVRFWTLGKSKEGRDIRAMAISAAKDSATIEKPREQIVLIGRQHPPEITGSLAQIYFVNALMEDTEIANQFRERFETSVVWMMNPDGVERGHWRHNIGGTDLNRDWGPFVQPETALMRDFLLNMQKDTTKRLKLFLDFHSTQKDVFYTLPHDLDMTPQNFIPDWLGLYQQKIAKVKPDYVVNEQARHDPDSTVSKAWVYEQFHVPAITFELGDETDRLLIEKIGKEAAYAMMETLLATNDTPHKD